MKKILSWALALSMLCSMTSGWMTAASAAAEEPAQAALVFFDGAYKNGFSGVKWGGNGNVKEENNKMVVTISTFDNQVSNGNYYSAADWIADGAIVMDANLQTTRTEGDSTFKVFMDVYRQKEDGSYTGSHEINNNWMSLQKDLVADGIVSVQTDETYQRVILPLDKTTGGWSGSGEANLADANRYMTNWKFQVTNDGTTNDTVRIDKFAIAHTGATAVDTVKYYTANGDEIAISGTDAKTLGLKPAYAKIKVKNFGLVDDKTLNNIYITDVDTFENTITTGTSFDMNTNTITLNIDADKMTYGTQYVLMFSDVKVYGGAAVEDYVEYVSVAEKTAMDSYKFLDYAGKDLGTLVTTDMETIEFTFTTGLIAPDSIKGFELYSTVGDTVAVEATLSGNKVNVAIKDDLEDGKQYMLLIPAIKTSAGEDVLNLPAAGIVEFSVNNSFVFFDDQNRGAFTTGYGQNGAPSDYAFTYETTTEDAAVGSASMHIYLPVQEVEEGTSAKYPQLQWKFGNAGSKDRDLSAYYEQGWSFSYWMKADEYDEGLIDGVNYDKMPYWHTMIMVADGQEKWNGIPATGGNLWQYAYFKDSGDWNYLSFPLSVVDNAATTPWNNVKQISYGINKPGNNVYFDEIKLVANTRIILDSLTLKDASGAVIEETDGILPATIEVGFEGNLDWRSVEDGIYIAAADTTPVDFDYVVDYANSVIKVTPTGNFAEGTEYTVSVEGLKNYGGAPQKNEMSATFTTAGEAPAPAAGYEIEYSYTDEGAVDNITVKVNVGDWDEDYVIYLALYQGGTLEKIVSQPATTQEATLPVDFETAIDIDAYEVKAFVWSDLVPIL